MKSFNDFHAKRCISKLCNVNENKIKAIYTTQCICVYVCMQKQCTEYWKPLKMTSYIYIFTKVCSLSKTPIKPLVKIAPSYVLSVTCVLHACTFFGGFNVTQPDTFTLSKFFDLSPLQRGRNICQKAATCKLYLLLFIASVTNQKQRC